MPKRYVAELQRLQSDAVVNYLLLHRLWQPGRLEPLVYGLGSAHQDWGRLTLRLIEASRWTEQLELLLEPEASAPHLRAGRLLVRSYQDVRLAEVVAFQHQEVREGRYAYPNPALFQPDEKVQLNAFLKEVLQFTLDQGYCLHPEVSHG